MEITKDQESFQNDLASALNKAWEDPEFKNQFINSPLETLEKLTGNRPQFKNDTKMVVVDQSEPDTFYFNIPSTPSLQDVELTEDQLELVAGGGVVSWLKTKAKEAAAAIVVPIVVAYVIATK